MNSASTQFHLGYRPSLNGLRGVAILMVLLDHSELVPGRGFGFVGVNTFFVLSGFLITCLLIEEYDRTNGISLKYFYFRRALRLLPALLAMLTAFVVFAFLTDPFGRAVRELKESLFALFYFSNWADILRVGRHVSLEHTWSLSIEEQFYILWPGILLWLLSKTSRSSLLCWIFLWAFVSAVFRLGLFTGGTSHLAGGDVVPLAPRRFIMGTDTRADSLLLGCFAGVLVSSNLLPQRAWFPKVLKFSAIGSGIGLLAMMACHMESPAPWMMYYGWFLLSVFGMILILHLASGSRSSMHLLFENAFLVYVGQISYGLYVWHYPILIALKQHHLPYQYFAYLLVVLPIVLVSYYLIEKPCLRFKSRFQRVG